MPLAKSPFNKIIEQTISAAKFSGAEAEELRKELTAHFSAASQDLLLSGKPETEAITNFGDPELIGAAVERSHEPHAHWPLIGDLLYYSPLRYGLILFIYTLISILVMVFAGNYLAAKLGLELYEKYILFFAPGILIFLGLIIGLYLAKHINNLTVLILTLTISLLPSCLFLAYGMCLQLAPKTFGLYSDIELTALILEILFILGKYFYSTILLICISKLIYKKIRRQNITIKKLQTKPLIKTVSAGIILLGLILGGSAGYNYYLLKILQPNCLLSELHWPAEPVLLIMRTASGKMEDFIPRLKVMSSDGAITAEFSETASLEHAIGTQEILVSGKLFSSTPKLETTGNLYYLNTEKIISILNEFNDTQLYNISLSPQQQFLRYEPITINYHTDKICISSYALSGLSACDNVMRLFPEAYRDQTKYNVRVDWLHAQEILGITISNTSAPEKIIESYTYDPATKIINAISADTIHFKFTTNPKDENEVMRKEYFNNNFSVIYNWREEKILIRDKTTDQQALLTSAPFMNGDFPAFDLFMAGKSTLR